MERNSSTDPDLRTPNHLLSPGQAPVPPRHNAQSPGSEKGAPLSAIERQLAREALRVSVQDAPSPTVAESVPAAATTPRWGLLVSLLVMVALALAAATSNSWLSADMRSGIDQQWQRARDVALDYSAALRQQWAQWQGGAEVVTSGSQPAVAETRLPQAGASGNQHAAVSPLAEDNYQRAEKFLKQASELVPALKDDPRFQGLLKELDADQRGAAANP